jgi:spore coat polysaccharide biosynthesis protein SpsF
MHKYLAVIQARMNSERLPGKVMLELCGRPVIGHVIDRLGISKKVDRIIVATTTNDSDDSLCEYLDKEYIDFFRGGENDVLGRFCEASRRYPSHSVVRATADNPLIDPKVLDETIRYSEDSGYRYVRTKGFPIGTGAEVFSSELLDEAGRNAKSAYEREHVTPYMYTSQENHGVHEYGGEYAGLRLTMDTRDDYEFIRDIYEHLYRGGHVFYIEDILRYVKGKDTSTK